MTLYLKLQSASDVVGVFLDGAPLIGGGDLGSGHHAGPSMLVGGVADELSTRKANGDGFQGVYSSVSTRQGSSRVAGEEFEQLQALPTGANPLHPFQVEKRAQTLAEEEAFAYERVRYAFSGLSGTPIKGSGNVRTNGRPGDSPKTLEHIDLSQGPAASVAKDPAADAAAAAAAAANFEGRGERRALWATAPANASLALAATERSTASGQFEYKTALLFPRPGELHTLEVTYRHKTGKAGIELSWESASMQPRAPIPASNLHRPLPLSKAQYPVYMAPDATHPPTSTAVGQGLAKATAGVAQTFTVEVRDQWGNLRLKGGDIISVVSRS